MTFKRISVSLCTIMICMMMFIIGYTKSVTLYSYADSVTDEWQNVTTNSELVEAFRYYCKSRDLTIDGSIADGVTKFTTKTFNGICNSIGIDVTALQAHLKYETDGNLGTKFLFDTTGISAYNRIFAQFLQDNNLAVGDSADETNNILYSGSIYTDVNGNSCLVWIVDGYVGEDETYPRSTIKYRGNYYIYNENDLVFLRENSNDNISITFPLSGSSSTLDLTRTITNNSSYDSKYYTLKIPRTTNQARNISGYSIYKTYKKDTYSGYPIIYYLTTNNTYHLGGYSLFKRESYNSNYPAFVQEGISDYKTFVPSQGSNINVNVFVTTNNNVINNNNYEGDTIINNNGTPTDPNDPDPDNPGYDPYPDGGGTTSDPSNTGGGSGEDDGVITFPDFDFHFPEIDWSLGDLSEKFPFSIPFDLIAFFTVLNAEPQAPEIDADIPLGTWYTWHFEADFSQFDNYAVIIRNVEFIGFCVALIYLTIRLVKG